MNNKRKLCLSALFLALFAAWTLALGQIDVQPIGPNGSSVGFAAMNGAFHALTGVHFPLYVLTDWLGLVPVVFMFGFALLGLVQWVRRKHLLLVDRSILVLGGFYLAVLGVYLFFEAHIVNYRPVLIGGFLEASYPSSTTLLVVTVMPAAILQLRARIRRLPLRRAAAAVLTAFTAFMVLGRLVSGVHWLSDIIGGVLLGAGLVLLYDALAAQPPSPR